MPSLESGVERTIRKGSGNSVDENLADFEMAFKLKKAIKRAKAERDPNYTGDNPETTGEVIKDLSVMGKVGKPKRSEVSRADRVKKVGDLVKKKINKKSELGTEEGQDTGQAQAVEEIEQQTIEAVAKQPKQGQTPEVSTTTGAKIEGGVETGQKKKTAIDEQIAFMKSRLKNLESSSKIFDKKADPEQKAERERLMKELQIGIAEAEKAKAKLEVEEKEKKSVKKVQARRNKDLVRVNPLKQALEDQINQIQKSGSTSEESTDKYAETLVKGVFGDDVFEREDNLPEVAPVSVDVTVVKEEKKTPQKDQPEKKAKKGKGKTSYTKKEPKKNGGPAPASGLTSDEEEEQRLRAERRTARAKEVGSKKEKPVVSSEPLAKSLVVEPKVETLVAEPPKEESRQVEAGQLNLQMDIPSVEKWGVSGEEPKGEKLFDKIHRLNEEVAEARAEYVKEDYENTKTWKKLFSIFRIKEDEKKGEWRALYEAKTLELQKAELEMVEAGEKDRQRDTRKEMSGLLHYYKLDERMNLVDERTQYRAKNLTFWGRIGDTFGALGRVYNRIPTKYKLALSGALIGASVATGGVLGATAYAAMMTRKVAASAGLAVGVEAGLEKLGEKRRVKQTGEEIEQQMLGLEGTTNEAFSNLEEILKKDILSLDSKLQHEKRAKTYRKLAATTLGVAVGSGWLSQIIMDKFGGKEALEWVKEHFIGAELAPEDLSLPKNMETHNISHALPNETLMTEVAVDTKAQAVAEVAKVNLIHDFVNKDIVVEKGDSVWKISERLADNLGLDGAEKTHFVDALKDKFGDVQLKAGEHINFSEHGINEDFVKHAIEDSNALSPEQLERISQNNLRLTAFAEANPNVRLTDEMTKNILEGKTGIAAEQASNEFRFGQPVDLEYQPIPGGISPEDIVSEYGARADGWYDQIFKVENVQVGDRILGRDVVESLKIRDVFHDAQLFQQGASGGYTTGLSRQEIANFAKFDMNVSNGKSILFDRAGFFRNNPNATVLDYLKKVASLTRRGQKIGSFTAL